MLASVAFCLGLDALHVAFSRPAWLAIDALVIWLLLRPGRTWTDWGIIALFPIAWASYYVADPARYITSTLVTVAQLLLAVRPMLICAAPARFAARWKDTISHRREWTDFDPKETHA